MAEPSLIGIAFEDAKETQQGASAVRRAPAKMTVSRSGACRGNTGAKELVGDFVQRHGGDPNNYQLTCKGAEGVGVMGLFLTKPGDKGVVNVKIYPNAIAFHAGACFVQWPKLRPATKVDCHIEDTVDAKGVPCLAVHVKAGTPTRTVKQKKEATASRPAPVRPDNAAGEGEESQG
ncbi:MAG TPA: hypothetical protein VK464_26115 [Symbiobacteriaceae bacterium]|nr:hypothetical protein [Symbiobacteriaceae bacterium]